MRFSTITRAVLGFAVLLVLFVVIRDQAQRHPENMPWTPLSLAQPIGMFTGRKLVALTDDAPRCLALLDSAGVEYTALPPLVVGNACGYSDGVQVKPGPSGIASATGAAWHPVTPKIACPVAAALHIWERDIVGPAAQRWFGKAVVGVDHLGSYNCRRIAGSQSMSQHATADAIDVAGIRLAGGENVTILADWNGTTEKAAFLREIRDGACRVFGTTLSPDYNAAHADHLHLDQANRGMSGGTCR
ncbi:extensin [Polymorphobacter glacialis]|uniref:Extensin n=1 Tax=Sandarakinorhabdus glacialis TaxID=1614636 RepID=A0A916ZPH1_9SPHN|nr:extensin family protein [Polymorphobacter glacialis]GGE07953.1 extensin [Polymorphobacter glacialis]